MSETHRIIVTVGLALGLVGGVLVGVEAVKFDNIDRLQAWIKGHRRSILGVAVFAFWPLLVSPGNSLAFLTRRHLCGCRFLPPLAIWQLVDCPSAARDLALGVRSL